MTEQDPDYALLTEIAVAYYDQEQTQEEIAQRFGISRIKVGRLLKKARQEGIVEISVKYHPVFSSQIEQQFISHFGIKRALIALDHHDEDEQRQQVAALVSNYLAGILKNDMTVTVGQGRNVAAVANHVGIFPERHCRFICGIGGTKRDNQLIDADHISRNLARKFNGFSETLYAPAYVETPELRANVGIGNSGATVGPFVAGHNTGFGNSGSLNTGMGNAGGVNTGFGNGGAINLGFGNSGQLNAGSFNAGSINTGNFNSGQGNTGDFNAGVRNTGWSNSGLTNTGAFNAGSLNTGFGAVGTGSGPNSGFGNAGTNNSGFFNTGVGSSGFQNGGSNNSGLQNAVGTVIAAGFGNTGAQTVGIANSGVLNSGFFNSGVHNSGGFNSENQRSGFGN